MSIPPSLDPAPAGVEAAPATVDTVPARPPARKRSATKGIFQPFFDSLIIRLTAASVLPAATAVATLLGVLFVASADHGQSEHMEGLAIYAMLTIGGGFTLLAGIGSLIGATLSNRRRGK